MFNQDQVVNLIQTIGKVGGAALATHGATQGVTNFWELGIGVAMTIVSWWFSHHSNASPAEAPPSSVSAGGVK
jgi:hypothetical protein